MNKNREQIIYQKTEFNNHKIRQLRNIFQCCKCKKNNFIMINPVQLCMICGTPNYTTKQMYLNNNIK